MEIGIYTFGDVPPVPGGARSAVEAQRLRDLLDEVELADRVGLDVYGVGEHHAHSSMRAGCSAERSPSGRRSR